MLEVNVYNYCYKKFILSAQLNGRAFLMNFEVPNDVSLFWDK